jgi:hypothetical protein
MLCFDKMLLNLPNERIQIRVLEKMITVFIVQRPPILFCPLFQKPRKEDLAILRKKILTLCPNIVWLLSDKAFHLNTNHSVFLAHETYYFFDPAALSHCYESRFLQTKQGLYRLPLLTIDLSQPFLKESAVQKKDEDFFFPVRKNLFYFKGDTTDRMNSPLFEQALLQRKNFIETTFSKHWPLRIWIFLKHLILAFYFFLLKKLDGHST